MIPMQKMPALILIALFAAVVLGFLAAESRSSPAVAGFFSRTPQGEGIGSSPVSSPPYTLYTEPDAGRAPILDAIASAKKSINLTIYNLRDKDIKTALKAAAGRGVDVRIIYDPGKDPEKPADDQGPPLMDDLNAAGIHTRPGPAVFPKTHQKTFTFDGKYSFVMTCNLKADTFSSTRDFIVRTDNPAEVREITEVFDADWNDRPATYRVPALVWSPDHARQTILSLIDNAQTEITVYNENLQDPQVVENLSLAAGRGVTVRVLIPSPLDDKKRLKAAERLAKAGVAIRQGTSYYIHAKAVVTDPGTDTVRGVVGSQNFEAQHLDKDRELGILLSDQKILNGIQAAFDEDWDQRSEPIPFPKK